MKKDRAMVFILIIASIYILLGPLLSGLPLPWLLTIDGIAAISVLSLYRYLEHEPVKFSPPWAFLFVLGGITLATLLAGGWAELVTAAQPAQRQVMEGGVLPPPGERSYLLNLAVMVTGPAVEEIIYRMAVLGTLAYFIGRAPALLISSIVFAAVHADVYPPVMLMPMFILGVLQGITFLLLGLPWAIAMHMLNNSRQLMTESFEASNIVALVVAIFSIWGLWVFLSRTIRLRRIVFGG
ncbi:CPBP family intramembrane glutamic endopeptidase [Oligoflexus tunisiensis]|uniref:CPBP family intramembrane glutamic endopeptidase n=1 Tax=Oligoflexus tunisiensis TaxID=708132 RepID=UPI001C4083EE|nr:CPBP family intramembrane glutamic endopeptidase [Oligoflexus tunisiensis]